MDAGETEVRGCVRVCVYMVQRCQPPPPPSNGHGSDKYPPPPCGFGPVVWLWWFRVLELV